MATRFYTTINTKAISGFWSHRACWSFFAAELCWSPWQTCSRFPRPRSCLQGLVKWEEKNSPVSTVNKTKTDGGNVYVRVCSIKPNQVLAWLVKFCNDVLISASFTTVKWWWWCVCVCVQGRKGPTKRWSHQPSYTDGSIIVLWALLLLLWHQNTSIYRP